MSRHDGDDSKVQCPGVKHDSLQLNSETVRYEVIHRPRVTRRIHLEIDPRGGLRVVAPKRMSRRTIHRALQARAVYVARFLEQARSRQQDLKVLTWSSGEEHFFMGVKLRLAVDEQPGQRSSVRVDDGQLHVEVPDLAPGRVSRLLARWYRQQAQQQFSGRLEHYSSLACWTGDKTPPMRLRRMKRTWGSCSSRGVITLNPHLVKAPAECMDYVIAHEICHLKEHNHGRAFYVLQEQLYPAWREAKALLRNQGHLYLHC
jgi:hypothetical protein